MSDTINWKVGEISTCAVWSHLHKIHWLHEMHFDTYKLCLIILFFLAIEVIDTNTGKNGLKYWQKHLPIQAKTVWNTGKNIFLIYSALFLYIYVKIELQNMKFWIWYQFNDASLINIINDLWDISLIWPWHSVIGIIIIAVAQGSKNFY